MPALDAAAALTLIAAGVPKAFIHLGNLTVLYEQGDLRHSLECFGYVRQLAVADMLGHG